MKAQENGVKLVVASGRLPCGVRPYAEQLDVFSHGGYYISYNGGVVFDSSGSVISAEYLDSKYIKPVYEILRPTNVTTMVHKGDVIYADRKVNAYTHVESDVIGIPLNPVDDIAEFVDWQLHKILLGGEPEELKSVEQKLLDKLGGIQDKQDAEMKLLHVVQDRSLTKYGVVKYDAFEDVGGKMSFVLALLDRQNTGIVLNVIHSKENCFLYLKEVVNGESYIMLSKEEIEALRIAVKYGSEEDVIANYEFEQV